jgi:GTPase
VQRVLVEIGAADIPQVLVFNKLDAIEPERRPLLVEDSYEVDGVASPRVFVSARQGEGVPQLRQRLARIVNELQNTVPNEINLIENDLTED